MKRTGLLVVLAIVVIVGFLGCNGYNGLVKQDESVKKAWNNVQTEYQIFASAYGTNLAGAPLFVNSAAKDYTTRAESPARGAGPVGLDLGWTIPEWAYLAGGPSGTTSDTTANFTVGGPGLIAFK